MQLIEDLIIAKRAVTRLSAEASKNIHRKCRHINSESDLRVLHVLNTDGPMTSSSCAEAAGMQRSAMSRMTDRLIKSGVVSEITDNENRTKKVLSITKKGVDDLARFAAGSNSAL